MDTEEFLAHHGIKGQRWGVRNDSKIFAKTTKEERRQIRRSPSAQRGRQTLADVGVATVVGTTHGLVVQKFLSKWWDAPAPIAGLAGSVVGVGSSSLTFKLLQKKHKNK